MKLDIKTVFIMIKQLRYILTSKQKKGSIVVFFIMFIAAILETFGVTTIMPFVYAVLEPEKLMNNRYVIPIVNTFQIKDNNQLIVFIGIAIIVVYIIKGIMLLFSSYIQIRFRCNFQKDLSIKMLTSYMRRPYNFFVDNSSSTIQRGIGSDVNSVFSLLENIFSLASEGITFLLIAIMIVIIDPVIFTAIFCVAIICILTSILFFKKKMRVIGEKFRVTDAEMLKYSYQSIMGIKEILVMQRQNSFIQKYKEAYERRNKCDIDKCFINFVPHRYVEAIFVTVLIGTILVKMSLGTNTVDFIPQLAVVALSAVRLLPSVYNMSSSINNIVYYRPALEATYNNIKDVEDYEIRRNNETKVAEIDSSNLLCFQSEIDMRNIYWKYSDMDQNILEDMSLVIYKGESVAFIGESGSGKTTAMDILLGLFKPQKGIVYMDGTDISTIPNLWSREIGYVPQSVFLIDDTVRANIAFGLQNEDIDDNKVWKALEQAQLRDFVEKSEHGLETIVGERGVKLSGGQRQRISIARALYHDPEILILDEATAALDNDTETAVMEAIDALQGSKTLIIVAHRLTTIRNCNRIYEIKNKHAILRKREEVLR